MLKQNRTGNKSLSGSKFRREIAMTNRLLPYFPNVRVIEASIHGSYSVFPIVSGGVRFSVGFGVRFFVLGCS